jgi:hypothetical protein
LAALRRCVARKRIAHAFFLRWCAPCGALIASYLPYLFSLLPYCALFPYRFFLIAPYCFSLLRLYNRYWEAFDADVHSLVSDALAPRSPPPGRRRRAAHPPAPRATPTPKTTPPHASYGAAAAAAALRGVRLRPRGSGGAGGTPGGLSGAAAGAGAAPSWSSADDDDDDDSE